MSDQLSAPALFKQQCDRLHQWLQQGNTNALQTWIKNNPAQAQALQYALLSDLIFAEVNRLPTRHPHSRAVFMALAHYQADWPTVAEQIKHKQFSASIKRELTHWYLPVAGLTPSSLEPVSPEAKEIQDVIRSALAQKYGLSRFYELQKGYDVMGFSETEKDFEKQVFLERIVPEISLAQRLAQPYILPQTLYDALNALTYPGDTGPLKALIAQDTPQHYPTLRIFALIQLGRSNRSGRSTSALSLSERHQLLKTARQEAQTLKSQELEFQAVVALAQLPGKEQTYFAHVAEQIIQQSPPLLQWERLKFWADTLMEYRQPAHARKLYTQILAHAPRNQRLGVLQGIGILQDQTMASEVRAQWKDPDPLVRAAAIDTWSKLHTTKIAIYPSFLFEDDSVPVQAYLLLNARIEHNPELEPLILKALASAQAPLIYAALTSISTQNFSSKTSPPFWSAVQPHLKSKDPRVLRELLIYLNRFEHHVGEQILPLLAHPDRQVKSMALRHMASQSNQVRQPASSEMLAQIRLLADHPDAQISSQALYLLIINEERPHFIEETLQLLTHPWFGNTRELLRTLQVRINQGALTWDEWFDQVQSKAPAQQKQIMNALMKNLYPKSEAVVKELSHRLPTLPESSQILLLEHLDLKPDNLPPQLFDNAYRVANDTSNPALRQAALEILAQSPTPDPKVAALFKDLSKVPKPHEIRALLTYLAGQNAYSTLYDVVFAHFSALQDSDILWLFTTLQNIDGYTLQYQQLIEKIIAERPTAFKLEWMARLRWHPDLTLPQQVTDHTFKLLKSTDDVYAWVDSVISSPGQYSTPQILTLLQSKEPDIQVMGMMLALKKGDPSLYEAIAPFLSSSAHITDTEYVAFDNALYFGLDQTYLLKAYALQTLLRLNKDKLYPELVPMLDHPASEMRWLALNALAYRDIPKAQIAKLQKDPDLDVRLLMLNLYQRHQQYRENPPLPLETWLPFLESQNPRTLASAIDRLDQYPELDHQKHLTPFLHSPNHEIKTEVQRIFKERARFDNEAAFLTYLQSDPYGIGRLNVNTLPASIDKQTLYKETLALLQNPQTDHLFSYYLVELLLQFDTPSLVEDLIALSAHRTIEISRYETWAKHVKPEDMEQLRSLLHATPSQQKFAIDTFATLQASDKVNDVLKLLSTADQKVERAILEFVAKTGNATQIVQLFPYLSEENSAAIYALSQNPHPELAPEVKALLSRPETAILGTRLARAWQLEALTPELIQLLKTPTKSTELRNVLIAAMGDLNAQEALPLLQKIARQNQSPHVVIPALYALGDPHTAQQTLIEILPSGDSDLRVWVLIQMQENPDPVFIPHLLPLLTSKERGSSIEHETSYELGELAADVLGEIGDLSSVIPMLQILATQDEDRQDEIWYGISDILRANQPLPEPFKHKFSEALKKQPPDIQTQAQELLSSE